MGAKLISRVFVKPDHPYTGSRVSLVILGVAAIGTILPACVHVFLPDGGANVIAGMGADLASPEGRRVVSLMAWAGTTQLVWGLFLLFAAVRHRTLVPLSLGLLLIERMLHGWHMWGPKGGPHHPPEAYATLAMIPVLAIAFALSLRNRA